MIEEEDEQEVLQQMESTQSGSKQDHTTTSLTGTTSAPVRARQTTEGGEAEREESESGSGKVKQTPVVNEETGEEGRSYRQVSERDEELSQQKSVSRSRGSRRKTEKEGDDESPGVLLLPAVDHERGEGVGSGSRSMVSVGGFSSTSRRVVVSSKSSVKHNQALVFCTLSILFLMGLMIVASVVVVAYTLSEIQAVEDALLKYRDVTLRDTQQLNISAQSLVNRFNDLKYFMYQRKLKAL